MSKDTRRTRFFLLHLVCAAAFLVTTVAYATSAVDYTSANGKLQDDHVNDVFIYEPTGETSSNALGFDANWVHGVAKTGGDPTVNPAGNITLSGTQTDKSHRIQVGIAAAGDTGTATFQTSLDGGSNWSSTIYTTRSTSQNLEYDGTDTGLDITFASGASWTFNDVFTIASWWGEGSGTYRSSAQDFPAKAAIIVTGAGGVSNGGVEIIDLSDNSVWMRFVASTASQAADQNVVAGPVHAVTALNGKIYLGGEGGYMGGVEVIDLMSDKVWFYDTGDGWDWNGNIAQRNDGDQPGPGWVQANPAYSSLTSDTVYDLDAAATSAHTYLAIGTDDRFNLLKDHANVYYNSSDRCVGDIHAVAVVGNDLYWGGKRISDGKRALCVRYDLDSIPNSSGSWPPVDVYDDALPANAHLISGDIQALAGRDGGSPQESSSNVIYVATAAGLTILHENQGAQDNGASYHYGYTGSSNADLDYKVLAGSTDAVSAVDFAPGYTGVYVATNDGAGGGAVSVLRPYIHTGDTPYLIEYYRTDTTPAILSNDVGALAHGSDLIVGTDAAGANRMTDAPTAVQVEHLAARPPGAPGWEWGLLALGLLAAAGWGALRGQV